MYRAQILLDPDQHKLLKEIAHRENRSMSDLVREMLYTQLDRRKKQDLALAAKMLLADYQEDAELTIFTNLDGEDFHA